MSTIINGSSPSITFSDSTTQTTAFTTTPVINSINSQASTPLTLGVNGTEVARINSSGQLLLGRTTAINAAPFIPSTGQNSRFVSFVNNTVSAEVGYIFCNNDNSTTQYATTSDYRLKQNVQRMAGALNKVTQLNPCTYDWKTGGSSQGFIAHELQEVCPEAVVGTKDQVNEEGNPVYQGIDTSFLVATLTAAIQELNDKVIALTPATPTEAQVTAKASALAKLTALGLSEDEVKALVG